MVISYDRYIPSIIRSVPLSGIRQVGTWPSKVDKKNQIALNIGQPDFHVPNYIKKAIISALDANDTSYTDILGKAELREEISSYLKNYHNLHYEPENEILVTNGGQSALFAIFRTFLSPGDKIVVPFPSYPEYFRGASYNQAKVLPVVTRFEDNFDLPGDQLEEIFANNDQIKLMVLCNPSNPTGTTYSKRSLAKVAKLAKEYDFLIISDEIYNRIYYGSDKYTSIVNADKSIKDRTLIINSFSKNFAMCGLRLGYISGPSYLIDQIKKMHHSMNICANSLAQAAGIEALRNREEREQSINRMVKTYKERLEYCLIRLKEIPNIHPNNPLGAFYLFPKLNDIDAKDFSKYLKYEYGVLIVPGEYFSAPSVKSFANNIRISYATSLEVIERGLNLLDRALEIFQKNVH